MRNPFIETLSALRTAIMRGDPIEQVAPKIGELAGTAVKAHNAALMMSACALVHRLCAAHGLDPEPVMKKIEAEWPAPRDRRRVQCTVCGRAWPRQEPPRLWPLSECTWDLDTPTAAFTEVIAVCGPACAAELAELGHPGYVSFADHKALQDFARRRGIDLPAPAPPAKRKPRAAERPS